MKQLFKKYTMKADLRILLLNNFLKKFLVRIQ